MTNVVEVVMKFVTHINKRDIAALVEMMTADHVFVDSLGNRAEGRNRMKRAWESYFRMMPEYEVYVEEIIQGNESVALFGIARGVYSPNGRASPDRSWSTPSAWKAEVSDGKIAEWRVYADNKPVYEMMAMDSMTAQSQSEM